MVNPLRRLQALGQSVWLDHFDRQMLYSGELAWLIEHDGLRGTAFDPVMFDQAFAESAAYDEPIRALAWKGWGMADILDALMVEDVQMAADLFLPLHTASAGRYGFAGLGMNPHLARDTEAIIDEARRLWTLVDRPNVFIQVPATSEGLPAIQQLIADGININVTLLFTLSRYRQAAENYLTGLERLAAGGRPPHARSVASFLLGPIDMLVDARLEEMMRKGGRQGEQAASLRGQTAIAVARQAYRLHRQIVSAERFQKLAVQGAQPQALLWGGTGAQSPVYTGIEFIEPLIGPDTICSMSSRTLAAYRRQGRPAARLEEEPGAADRYLRQLGELGIELEHLAGQLEEEGIDKLVRPYDSSLWSLRHKVIALREPVA